MSKYKNLVVGLMLAVPILLPIEKLDTKAEEASDLSVNLASNSKDVNPDIINTQEVSTPSLLTPIPTETPRPTVMTTPIPVPSVELRVERPAPTPASTVIPYSFRYANRTALDYPQIDKEYVKQRICFYFPSNCNDAILIATKESSLRTNAASSGYYSSASLGLFQIHCKSHKSRVGGDCSKLFDLETNLQVAKAIYTEQKSWSAWDTCHYLNPCR